MTKKDYILIAKVISNSFDVPYSEGENALIFGLVRELKKDNPKFSGVRFMKACGYNADGLEYCPNYQGEKVLPDENGNCSLCDQHKA